MNSNFLPGRGHSPCGPVSLKAETDSTAFLSSEKHLNFLFHLVWVLVVVFGGEGGYNDILLGGD